MVCCWTAPKWASIIASCLSLLSLLSNHIAGIRKTDFPTFAKCKVLFVTTSGFHDCKDSISIILLSFCFNVFEYGLETILIIGILPQEEGLVILPKTSRSFLLTSIPIIILFILLILLKLGKSLSSCSSFCIFSGLPKYPSIRVLP